MPEIGHIIASKYNVVLLHISDVLIVTFLPLRSIPLSRSSHKIIAIGFVNRNHFIEVCKSLEIQIMLQYLNYWTNFSMAFFSSSFNGKLNLLTMVPVG